MFLTIVLGLLGLGLVVFVHEAGHLLAAKAVGVEVEAFSIGWGRTLISRKWGETDYRLSLFPLGGYCKMKGEASFQKAVEENADEMPREHGSFYGASVWRRIVILVAGPAANFIFAILVLSLIWFFGFSFETFENRIVVAAEYQAGASEESPAISAGLETGDRIISINGDETPYFRNIQQQIAPSADRRITMEVDRNGDTLTVEVTPRLDPATGAGVIGIAPWIEPIVDEVSGSATVAGLQPGDRILSVDGREVPHSLAFSAALQDGGASVEVEYERDGEKHRTRLAPDSRDGRRIAGNTFPTITGESREYGFAGAFVRGTSETFETMALTVRGIGTLFRGVDVTQAVAGPARIVYLTGEVASRGFDVGLGAGISSLFNFLGLLSVILCFMNLLPIPVFDGGQIVISLAEGIRRKPFTPRTMQRYQMVGAVMVFALLIFAITADVLFFTGG